MTDQFDPGPAGAGPQEEAAATPGATGPQGAPVPSAVPEAVRQRRGARSWLAVAIVAALVGGAVGAIVTAVADDNGGQSVTIRESNSPPAPSNVGGGVSIPKLVRKMLPSVVSIEVDTGQGEEQGTGIVISAGGLVVTNNHVIADARTGGTMTVTESGSTEPRPASLVGTDPSDDVALVQITGASGLTPVTFGNSSDVVVGQTVLAIGNALGLQAGTPSVTLGIVSALGRTVTAGSASSNATETLTGMIQTDAAINPGNSGGPLIDTAGQVIAMNTAVAGSTGNGTSAQNIGFAIPASKIESLLPELMKGGTVAASGAALGVVVEDLTPAVRQQYDFTPEQGAVVLEVLPGSPAAKAGLKEGDVIVSVGGHTITSAADLSAAVQGYQPGQTVSVTYYTKSTRSTVSLMLEARSAEQQQEGSLPAP